MFLIRTAFWLSIVILLLPAEQTTEGAGDQQSGNRISASEVFAAAKATISDVSSICERSPDVCEAGRAAAETFGNKARYGAQLLMDYVVEENSATPAPQPARSLNVETTPVPDSQNTLSQSDLQPRWGGPFNDNA
jgi:uncharacterized protein DUF5330